MHYRACCHNSMAIQDARGAWGLDVTQATQNTTALASHTNQFPHSVRQPRLYLAFVMAALSITPHHTGWRSWPVRLAWASCCSSSAAYCGTTGGRCLQVGRAAGHLHTFHTSPTLYTAFIYVLVPMPHLFFGSGGGGSYAIYGSNSMASGWVDAGKFLTGFSAVGSVAVPAILYHAEVGWFHNVTVFHIHGLLLRRLHRSHLDCTAYCSPSITSPPPAEDHSRSTGDAAGGGGSARSNHRRIRLLVIT